MTVRVKKSAVISQRDLNEVRSHFERAVGILLLLFSVIGSVIAFNGGWPGIAAGHWSFTGVLAGLGVQAGCTLIEWLYRVRRLSAPYLIALVVDTGSTIVGFGPIFHDQLTTKLPIAQDLASWLAWGIIGAVALLLAFAPEGVLIDDARQEEKHGSPARSGEYPHCL
jgi:hypothetical protein